LIFTKLPNAICETQVLKLVFITIPCLKFWALKDLGSITGTEKPLSCIKDIYQKNVFFCFWEELKTKPVMAEIYLPSRTETYS